VVDLFEHFNLIEIIVICQIVILIVAGL